jgi:hypothetical protein
MLRRDKPAISPNEFNHGDSHYSRLHIDELMSMGNLFDL